jgi:hypothetical protein
VLDLFRLFRKKGEAQPEKSGAARYQAVRLQFDRRLACAAVRELEHKVFLGNEAPTYPLLGCSRKGACKCSYRHLSDRREDMRRDSDHGLPERLFDAPERRSGLTDRRRQRVA